MIWLNFKIPEVHNEAFIHATREEIGAWFLLVCYCGEQENMGKIRNCRNWAPATWARIIGTDRPSDHCSLWRWRGDHLDVLFYPREQECRLVNQRVSAKIARDRRWVKSQSSDQSSDQNPEA